MVGTFQGPESELLFPLSHVYPHLTRFEISFPDFPPIAAEDLVRLGVESQLIPFIVSTTLRAEQSPNGSPPLSPKEAENLVEILDKVRLHLQNPAPRANLPGDQVLSSTTVNPSLKNRCFRVLRKISPTHAILPRSYFPSGVTLSDTIPYASGGFAEIWNGHLEGNQVCVKAFRTQTVTNLEKIKRVCGSSLSRQGGELKRAPIRGSAVRS